MTTDPRPAQPAHGSPARRAYARPRLTVYGTIREITQANAAGAATDSAGAKPRKTAV